MELLVVAASASALWADVDARRIQGPPLRPTLDEREAYTALVEDIARAAPRGAVPSDAEARAAELGLVFERQEQVVWLREPLDDLVGRGVVMVRLGRLPSELVLQAPHPVSDLHTGAVTADLFGHGGVRAACIATFHRDAAEGVDPSRDATGWLQAATEGLVEALPRPLFVQLHGFAADTSSADLVLSEGSGLATEAWLANALDAVEYALNVSRGLVGFEEPALAARGNVQSQLLAGRARFLHLEMSLPVRSRLATDPALRAELGAALSTLASGRNLR